MTTLRERVFDALGTVYDPELDEPITSLRFVSSCEVTPGGDVFVSLRLPTPQCAPNFAFLMAADARAAVRRLPGVKTVSVELEDHYTRDEINAALARDEGFTGAFPGETEDDTLDALRVLFMRKALTARQTRVCEALLEGGDCASEITSRCVSELPDWPEVRRCLELRAELGLACDPDAPAFVLPDGRPVAPDQVRRWLRMGRLVRTSLEANGGICRSLLQFRYEPAPDPIQRRSER
jgi:metal-sulfur cluster biosynthetic enzyme